MSKIHRRPPLAHVARAASLVYVANPLYTEVADAMDSSSNLLTSYNARHATALTTEPSMPHADPILEEQIAYYGTRAT